MVERMIGHLEDQLAAIDAEIEKTADDDEELTAKRDLLRSIPGIGPVAAATILAELPDVKDLGQARRAVAYVGLNPSLRQSGTSVNAPARISRIGHAGLRTALYMPALAAMRHNPLVAALCKRLKEAGRLKPKQIVVAAMRKLLQLCFGVLKTGQAFNPSWTSKTCDRPITAT